MIAYRQPFALINKHLRISLSIYDRHTAVATASHIKHFSLPINTARTLTCHRHCLDATYFIVSMRPIPASLRAPTTMELIVISSPAITTCVRNPLLSEIIARSKINTGAFQKMTYVVDRSTMRPIEPIAEYLFYCRNTLLNSSATIRNKANALYEFFLYLDALQRSFRSISLDDLLQYRERLRTYISRHRSTPLAPGTINIRISTAVEFLSHHGVVNTDLARDAVRHYSVRPVPRKPTSISKMLLKRQIPIVEHISNGDLKTIFDLLKKESHRNWLAAAFCLSTGCRLDEGLGLTVAQIKAARSSSTPSSVTYVTITRTKGGEPRTISVDGGLVQLIGEYITNERTRAVSLGQRARGDHYEPAEVFLNGPLGAASRSGTPLTARRMQDAFASAQLDGGVTREQQRYHPVTKQPIGWRTATKHTFHHLRHTFAINAWKAYASLPEADRWMALQKQLGHASHTTTADIYLRAVDALEPDSRDLLTAYYKRLMEVQQ